MPLNHKIISGVIQVHSDKSGGMSLERSLEAARETGVNFIVFTEKNADKNSRKLSGWYGDVLVLVAEEVRHFNGEFLAFDCPEFVQSENELSASLSKVHRHSGTICGTSSASTNEVEKRSYSPSLEFSKIDMISIWSFLDEFVTRVSGDRAMMFQQRPERVIYGPHAEKIREWDREQIERPFPAIGCVNALLRKDPLLQWKEFFTFRTTFKTIRTAILIDDKLPEDSKSATRVIWKALRAGKSIVYNHAIGSIEEFEFRYIDSEKRSYYISDQVPYRPGGKIFVSMPQMAEIVIRRNGEPLFWGTGTTFEFPTPVHGVYRIEAYIDRRLWLISNAIRISSLESLREPPDTISEFT